MLALAPIKNAGIVQEHDLPGDLAPGATQLVTWSLDIYDCEGFARFQVQFPNGISAQPVETASASFSFEDGKAKFIWMELPPKNTLEVSLEISATSDFQGAQSPSGSRSFEMEGEKMWNLNRITSQGRNRQRIRGFPTLPN